MKGVILFSMFVISLVAYNQVYAQFDNPAVGFGFAAGGAQGDNSGADKWVIQYRGYFQYKLVSPILLGQLSVGYTKLNAPGVYTAETGMADNRLLFIPFSLEKLNPFLYGGFGVSKAIGVSGSDFLPMIPMGAGIQTRLGSQMLLEVSGGYNLSLSDKLDGRQRSSSDLNSLTNKKHDGYFGFLIGLMFTGGSNANADPDKDGLSNKVEKELGTDPKKPDTDGDGLSDGAEVNQYKTDPAKADTDGDGLSEGDEVNKYKTDPVKIDTDGGGANDGAEVKSKTNPLDSKDDVAKATTTIVLEKGKKVILRGVNFETNKATLTGDSEYILEVAYNALVANPDVQVEISGHTDSVGSDEYNQELSLRRAQAVRNWLEQRGIAGYRMKTVGKGEKEPVADNGTVEGRTENRRIEFYVQQ